MTKTTTGSKANESRAIDKNNSPANMPKGFRKSASDGPPELHLDYIFGFLIAAMEASNKAHRKSTRKLKK